MGVIQKFNRLFKFPDRDMLRLYNQIYFKWANELTRFEVNLFKWDGLPCPQDVIELYLIRDGVCGNLIDSKQGNIIVAGGLYGVTNYPNVFTDFIYATPLTSGSFKINNTGVICKGNHLMLPDIDCIDLTAHLLTHVDLSIQSTLINMRANNAFGASNETQKETILGWLKELRKGKPNVILNKNSLTNIVGDDGIKTFPTYQYGRNELPELYFLRENLLRDYFAERGFVSDKQKSERLVTAELSINVYRTLFSISDMLEERQNFCERANKLLGTHYSVKFNEYIEKEIEELINGGGENAQTADS